MPKSLFMANIKVFARLKPCQDINQEFVRREDEAIFIHSREQLCTNAISSGWTTNLPPSIRFRFSHVFGTESSQKNVFDVAAKDIVKAFIEGHNGTIFAYGQTGAGKTYTIQGESDNFTSSNNNGLIPRSLSMIFEDIGQIEHETVSIHVSFLEIHEEIAFDLLGPIMAKGGRKSKEVLVTVAGNGSCHLHGLSYHHVESVDEAARLYQLGMANHKTAETPDNKRSSRSHTVFSIKIMRQKHGEEILLRSKLNLVDLAGSERVWKLGVDGRQVSEAKYINFSLHHLETVIIALQKFSVRCLRKKQAGKCLNRSSSAITQGTRGVDVAPKPRLSAKLKSTSAFELGKGRQLSHVPDRDHTHVPYGNSLLTMVLQDSLGGNCNTAMIAALSLEEKNLPETIATCRFAQRVARIVNKPIRNEEIDKNMVIRRLQTTLAKLHLELANYKGKSFMLHLDDKTSPDDEEDCVEVIHAFLAGSINDPVSHGINTPTKFRTSLRYLRQMLGEARVQCSDDKDSGVRTGSEPTSPLTSEGENDLHRVSNFIAHLPCPVGDLSQHRASVATQESGISLNTEHEVTATDENESSSPDRSYRTAQRPGPVSSGPCTQTGLLKTYEGRKLDKKDACVGIDQPAERKDVLITELELEKEALLNKSKIFTSRLADQRARLVVMSRRGDLPEELENEKIVELQLQKKKREVESKLSLVIKKLADLKYTERLRQQCKQIKEHHQVPTKTVKELELKEKCTRQKLLARREQMRSLGFSSPTLSPQSASSTVSFRSGTGHSSLSRSSSMTLRWEEAARESGEQCRTLSGSTTSSVPASSSRDICGQPTTSRSGMGGDLRRIQKMMSCPQSSFPRRGLSGQKILLNRDVKSGTLKNTGKRCPLVEYISNSHRALYHKSTFPRRIENDVYCNMRGTKNMQRTVPKKQRAQANNEPKLARSSPNVSLQLNGQASDPGGTDWVTKIPPDKMNPENNLISVIHTKLNDEEGTPRRFVTCDQSSAGETTTSESGEEIRGQNPPSVICLNREQRERIMKIREFVNAAEVIQRKWRMYKRNKNGEVSF